MICTQHPIPPVHSINTMAYSTLCWPKIQAIVINKLCVHALFSIGVGAVIIMIHLSHSAVFFSLFSFFLSLSFFVRACVRVCANKSFTRCRWAG